MNKFKTIFFVTIGLFFSCNKDENETNENQTNEITVSISDFIVTVDENPNLGMSIGIVEATTNQESLLYSITEQSPNDAIKINSSTGEITVLTESLFDFEINPSITGKVRVENGNVFKEASILINLNDIDEIVINHKPIYYFKSGSLISLNLNDEGGLFYEIVADDILTEEIYGIAYDPFDNTLFGTTHYTLGVPDYSSFESYNLETGERIKKRICQCRHNSVTVNTKLNKKNTYKMGRNI